ncbi:MAG: acetyl-CoA carboxylase, carboxyltransferase subunit beta [Polyangiaceae bacterium]|nr:acetyl-CoA carboxylase, carboxyltransferase subunit beta [Polyangiaceae bacterium]
MSWPEKTAPSLDASEKRTIGAGIFRKCDGCAATITAADLAANFEVCPACGHHHILAVDGWRKLLLDDGLVETWDDALVPTDPLGFTDGKSYPDRVVAAQKRASSKESVEIGRGHLSGESIAYGAFNFAFMGGSMGSVAGEKVTRLFERATADRLPVVLLQASGGARMQEGILSLMQMAKAVSALERFRAVKKPFVSALLHPTTGGVAASFAFLGDVNVVEPKALIGFAGPRVIENTLRTTLPRGFQRSEFLLDHGMVDLIVSRLEMKQTIATVIRHLSSGR